MAAILVVCAPPADANATTPRLSGIHRAHHNHRLADHRETLAGHRPHRDIGRIPRPCNAGCWWHRAVLWGRVAAADRVRLDRLRHPSSAACYALVRRRFAGTGMVDAAIATVARESGCRWSAQNPVSTAAGPWQFLDGWGSYAHRTDAVWSTATALRAFRAQGGPCPAWCVG